MADTDLPTNPLIKAELEGLIKLAYLPTTTGELIEYFAKKGVDAADTTIRHYVGLLEDENLIEVSRIANKRDNLFLWQKENQERHIKIDITGRFCEKSNLILATGLMNFYDLAKICGIHPYRPNNPSDKIGVQRPKRADWIKELEGKLTASNAIMASSALVYMDFNIVRLINSYGEQTDFSELEPHTQLNLELQIPYYKYSFDSSKPAQILDGQQRMWALEHARILRVFRGDVSEDELKLMGPVTFIIGNFSSDKEKSDSIRRLFINANATRDLPRDLQQQLASSIGANQADLLPDKIQYERIFQELVQRLNHETNSPFHDLIDLRSSRISRRMTEKLSNRAMVRIVKQFENTDIFEKIPANVDLKNDRDFLKNLERIFDYFNAIKWVFEDAWNDIDQYRLRGFLVLMAFAGIPDYFWTLSDVIDRKDRIRKIVRELLKIREETEFQSNEPYLLNRTHKKSDINQLADRIKAIHADNIRFLPPESELDRISEILLKLKIKPAEDQDV